MKRKPRRKEPKVLVAYFSATGTTEGVAEHIANGLNADIYGDCSGRTLYGC
ncbi:MAG: flavodoxin [Clostridia bacterium]